MPTEGDPAIVGNWLRLRSEVSDCFCIELTVCKVSLDVEEAVLDTEVGVEVELDEGFNRATRCAVAGSKAAICIGGRLTGDLGFLGSVDDNVCRIVEYEYHEIDSNDEYLATFSFPPH